MAVDLDANDGDGFVGVGDCSVTPATNLVPEGTESTEPPQTDRAFDHHVAIRWEVVERRSHFDGDGAGREPDDQRRVVEVAPTASLELCRDELVDPPRDADRGRVRTERYPVEIDAHRLDGGPIGDGIRVDVCHELVSPTVDP